MGQDATPAEAQAERLATAETPDLEAKLATAEAEIAGPKALLAEVRARSDAQLAAERARGDELRQDLAAWRERVPVALPVPTKRSWRLRWPWSRAG